MIQHRDPAHDYLFKVVDLRLAISPTFMPKVQGVCPEPWKIHPEKTDHSGADRAGHLVGDPWIPR